MYPSPRPCRVRRRLAPQAGDSQKTAACKVMETLSFSWLPRRRREGRPTPPPVQAPLENSCYASSHGPTGSHHLTGSAFCAPKHGRTVMVLPFGLVFWVYEVLKNTNPVLCSPSTCTCNTNMHSLCLLIPTRIRMRSPRLAVSTLEGEMWSQPTLSLLQALPRLGLRCADCCLGPEAPACMLEEQRLTPWPLRCSARRSCTEESGRAAASARAPSSPMLLHFRPRCSKGASSKI